jgi:hypothetical protein
VIDLGSGGGIDVLLAATKVGVKGKAIGIDMTKVCWLLPIELINFIAKVSRTC